MRVPVQDAEDQEVPKEVDDLQQEDGQENQILDPVKQRDRQLAISIGTGCITR